MAPGRSRAREHRGTFRIVGFLGRLASWAEIAGTMGRVAPGKSSSRRVRSYGYAVRDSGHTRSRSSSMSSSDGVRDGSRLPWFVRRNRRALSKFVEELVNLGWRRRGMDQFDCGSPGFVFVFQRVGRYFALILTLQKTDRRSPLPRKTEKTTASRIVKTGNRVLRRCDAQSDRAGIFARFL